MRKISQAGYSLLMNLGLFSLVLFVLGICVYWISLYQHKEGIEEVVQTVSNFYGSYGEMAPQMISKRVHLENPIHLKTYGLLSSCKEEESFFDKNRKICQIPLGELDVRIDYVYPFSYTYMYVHFTDMYKRSSCEQFLSAEWEKIVPKEWWGTDGYIGVISENTSGKMYFSHNEDYIAQDGAEENPTKKHRHQVCKVCKNSRYCSVLLFFTLNENIFKNSENAIAIPNEINYNNISLD